MSSADALKFLSEPATLASLAAVAAAGMAYMTSRPTPLKCPVDPEKQSVEVPVSSFSNLTIQVKVKEHLLKSKHLSMEEMDTIFHRTPLLLFL